MKGHTGPPQLPKAGLQGRTQPTAAGAHRCLLLLTSLSHPQEPGRTQGTNTKKPFSHPPKEGTGNFCSLQRPTASTCETTVATQGKTGAAGVDEGVSEAIASPTLFSQFWSLTVWSLSF